MNTSFKNRANVLILSTMILSAALSAYGQTGKKSTAGGSDIGRSMCAMNRYIGHYAVINVV